MSLESLQIALDDVAAQTRLLCDQDPHEFIEAYARVEQARRTLREAARRYQYKTENRQKMALLRDLVQLRRQ